MRDENEFLDLLKAHNENAFGELYEKYAGALYGIILKRIPDHIKASEILCNVFVEFSTQIKQSKELKVGICILLFRIATRLSNPEHLQQG